jgi:molybdopterin biosynthesis enzyme
MVGAHFFLDRVLSGLLGEPPSPHPTVRAKLAAEVATYLKGSAPEFLTLVLVRLEDGRAHPVLKDSMSVMGAAHADGFFAVPPGKAAPRPGDEVAVVLWR